MSQPKLGKALGLSFQQIQKYEKRENRISAANILAVAHVLEFPIEAFFCGLNDNNKVNIGLHDHFDKTTAELIMFFSSLRNRKTKLAILNLLRSHVKDQQSETSQE